MPCTLNQMLRRKQYDKFFWCFLLGEHAVVQNKLEFHPISHLASKYSFLSLDLQV
jgi:hypothetical protein